MVEGSKRKPSVGHLALKVFLLSEDVFRFEARARNVAHMVFVTRPRVVYVTKFTDDVCLPVSKGLGRLEDIGWNQRSFCPEDEITANHLGAEAVRRRSTTVLPFRLNPEPHL